MKKVLALLFSFSALAKADVTDLETRQLIKARNSRDLVSVSKVANDLRLAKAECEAQIRAGFPPISCFDSTRIETSLGLIDQYKARVLIDGYSSQCEERARSAVSIEILDAALNKRNLPPRCQSSLKQRREELLYIISAGGITDSRSGI